MNLLQHLQSVKDPRTGRARRHDLQAILFIALSATIAGADNWVLHLKGCIVTISADVFVHSIGAHWAVENQLHWSLDVAMREDAAQSYSD
jgi:predicted transposase YbfD/YdcC